jgi:putative DNA primase/helicase
MAKKDDTGPKVRLPFGFKATVEGIVFEGDGEGEAVRICGPLDVLAETRDDRGSNWGLLLAWRDNDSREHRWAMPRSMLAGDGVEIRAAFLDQGLTIASGRKARERLNDFLCNVRVDATAWAVDRLGWQDGCFALPDRTIGETAGKRVIFQNANAHDHAYHAAGALADWQVGVAALCIGNSRLGAAISAAFVGPLLGLLGEEGGGLHFRGPSSIGKSTARIAAASVWGQPERYVRQWRATANGLEGVAVQHSETLLCLDELGQLDPREAGGVAYLLANGSGKARAGRSGAARAPATWRTFFLSSGEIGLAELAARDGRGAARPGAGQEVRIIDIEADAGKGLGLFDTIGKASGAELLARKIKEAAGNAFGIAGPTFVAAIIAKGIEPTRNEIRKGIDAFASLHLPENATGQAWRAASRFGLIATAGEMASKLGVLPWPEGEASRAVAVLLHQWLAGRGGAGASEDVAAVSQVRAFLELHGSSRFEVIRQVDEGKEVLGDGRAVVNRAGFYRVNPDGGQRVFYIMREAWKEVCAGIDPKRAARRLGDRGMLKRDSAGGSTYPVTLPTIGKARVYLILPTIFTDEAA